LQGQVDGILAHITDAKHAARLRRTFGPRIPIVDVGNICRIRRIPSVCSDEAKVGCMAAQHFLERGFVNLACYVYPIGLLSAEREASFRQHAKAAGAAYYKYVWPCRRHSYGGHPLMLDPGLRSWLKKLPKPVGILCANDALAFEVMETCHILDIHVPEEVAVLGVDDNTDICDLTTPPLSSIALATAQIGFEAAATLDRMMSGARRVLSVARVPPLRIATRQSTDVFALSDPQIAAAVRFIHSRCHDDIRVSDVLRAVPMARRSLEMRFQSMLGRSPLAEIRRVRIERAKDLLARTDFSVEQIAEQSGFKDVKRLYFIFRRMTGTSPARWRLQIRRAGYMPQPLPPPPTHSTPRQ